MPGTGWWPMRLVACIETVAWAMFDETTDFALIDGLAVVNPWTNGT